MNRESCFLAGRIRKTLGFEGELLLAVDKTLDLNWEELEFFWVDTPDGLVPYFAEYIELRNDYTLEVKFLDAADLAQAKALCGFDLYLPLELMPEPAEDTFSPSLLVGFEVIDKTQGSIGRVEEIVEYPEQSLIRIGSEKDEILIPMVKELITRVDMRKKKIHVDLPLGLLGLNRP